ncbi:MAG: TetR/AcrR family transcriptional regulator [Solirubrobacteraceae bacterium]
MPTPNTTDPRVERSRLLILEAAVRELADRGYGGVTMEGVAGRAGVAKSTIYRHWSDKLSLIADAFETFHERLVPDLGAAPVRDSVVMLLGHVADVVADSLFSRCIPAMIEGAERDPRVRESFHRYCADRRRALVDLIARGVREGELAPAVDPGQATIALLGVIFYRRLMTGRPFAAAEAPGLVRSILGPG